MPAKTVSTPRLSPAFVEFAQHLDASERERLTERRLTSPQESRNESVQEYILNRSSKL